MPPVPKKIPMRQCVGCREHRPKKELVRIVRSPEKKELVRIVRSPEGVVSLDFSGKANGRGAYLCRRPECLRKAVKARALERAFSAQVPEDVVARLEKELVSTDAE